MDQLFSTGNLEQESSALRNRLKELERKLALAEQSAENLSMALDATAAGTWDWDMVTGSLTVNAHWAAMIGYDLKEISPLTIRFWQEHCHPDDLERSNDLLREHFEGKTDHYELELRIRHKEGHWIWVLDRGKVFSRDESGNPTRMIGSHQEITGRKTAEEALKWSRAFERLTTTISNRFINLPSDEIDGMVQSTLQLIGEQVQADRCYVFQFSEDLTLMDNTHEWCAEGIEPQIDLLKELPTGTFPWWMQKINNNEVIHIPILSAMPEEGSAEKEILESQNIQSLLVIPLAAGPSPFGYIGFDAVREARNWPPETVSVLKLAGGVIANALQRKMVETIIQAELDLAIKLSATATFDQTLNNILRCAFKISGMEAGGIYLVDHEKRTLTLACHEGLSQEFIACTGSYSFDTEQAELILKGEPVYADYTTLGLPCQEAVRNEKPRAIAILPVSYHGEVIACLNVTSHKLSRVPDLACKGLETIASHIGAAIAHACQEEQVSAAKNNLESLFDTIDDFLFIIDQEGKVIASNAAVTSKLGYEPGDQIGRHTLEFHPEERHQEALTALQEMLEGKSVTCTVPLKTRTGELIPVDTKVARGIWDKQPVLFGISRNISDLINSERARLENEQHFRGLTELLPLPLFEVDTDLNITYSNHICSETFSYSQSDMQDRMQARDLCIPEDRDKFALCCGTFNDASCAVPENNEYTCLRKDGTRFPALFYSMPIISSGRIVGASCMFVDLTESKKTEEALRNSALQERIAQEFKSLIDNIPGAVYRINSSGASMLSMYPDALPDFTREEFQHDLLETYGIIHPDDRQLVIDSNLALRAERKSDTLTYRILTRNGEVRWIEDRKTSTFSPKGEFTGIDGILFDITTRIRAQEEKQKLESRLRKSQRLETIGTLAGGIAHDFNNILTPILGYAEMGVMSLAFDDVLHDYFSEIMLAAERAQNLVSQILTFSRAQESTPAPMSVQAIVNEALKLLRPSIPSSITIEQLIDKECRNILADPSQIHQVIINLCTNAFQAMEGSGGKLKIELNEITPDATMLKVFPKLRHRPYLRLSVSDTGIGMDEATIERIFEPFFTTKSVEKGTGLGLSVVHGIIVSCNGEITVESTPGKGTTFSIFLPVIDEKVASAIEDEKPLQGSGSILFIDDEIATVEMMTLMLSKLGFTIHAEKSPIEALRLYRNAPERFDLVITDLTMPEMTGIQLSEELRKINPGLPVILMTGYGQNSDIALPLDHYGISRLLKKPVKLAQMASTVNELLISNKNSSPALS
ncbi:MAG: PAS domain S-box protein [Chlorobiaceae bacterium]|nr:PAS domain S-box protein [Chlorobiaceae bacterium]